MASAHDAAQCERVAIRAYLLGADDDCVRPWEAAQRSARAAGDPAESARYAFWLGFVLLLRGQTAPASGWLARADALIAQAGSECPASGYVLIPRVLAALDAGDVQHALDLSVRAIEIGNRCHDADLVAFGTLCHGQALIAGGERATGVARLDDVMVSVTAGDLGPITTGIVYCAVISECMDLVDLRRAAQWTEALAGWCDAQPGLVPFRGQCLVHRSQLQQAEGDWSAATASAQSACRHLAEPPHPALGLACYQDGELHRLRGEFEAAARSYRRASRHGHDPMPGSALLQLARGEPVPAAAAIQRALAEGSGSRSRPALLAAAVEIHCATDDFVSARAAADELAGIADQAHSQVFQAMAGQAAGSVLMAAGDAAAALVALRAAARTWQSLRMPYDAARTAVLMGLACAALGDSAGAEMEFGCAADTFTTLGAGPDLARVNGLRHGRTGGPTTLSDREREVLVHLAAGRTNREIAARLVVSPHTVARHVEHIYAKLGVTNRAAATAYAYQHHLL
jgi:DNA-binding NarL/FixJ family response regulator